MTKRVSSRACRAAALVTVLSLLPLLAGCAFARAFAFLFGEQATKPVKAEYPYLSKQKVCITVRADMETIFEYPHVQWEVADYVRVALEQNVPGVNVTDPRRVVDYQRSNPDWERTDPAELGHHFAADRLLEIDLTQYTTREPDSPHLYRGYIAAMISVYNTAYPNSAAAYSGEVKTVYPPESMGEVGTGDRAIRRAMMEAFADDVAGKFYDRNVKVK